jgi:hypothetical protein
VGLCYLLNSNLPSYRFAISRNFKSAKYTVKNPDSRVIMVLQDREFAEIVKGDEKDNASKLDTICILVEYV